MKNLIMKARVNMMKGMVYVRGILTDRSGSGMIDLAIFPVEDVYDTN